MLLLHGFIFFKYKCTRYLKTPEISFKYPVFINVYGVGKRYSYNSYNGLGIKFHNDKFEGSLEKGPDFLKLSLVGVNKFNNGLYSKLGFGYLKVDEYKVLDYTINPNQKTYGLAFGYTHKNNLNIEAGYISHQLDGIGSADTTAYTKYLELVYRTDTNISKFDVIGVAKQEQAYGKENMYTRGSVAYYPANNLQIETTYNNLGNYTSGNYNIQAGFKYMFVGGKKGKFTPFVSLNYYNSEKVSTRFVYEENIANRPLYWKDEFESCNKCKANSSRKSSTRRI